MTINEFSLTPKFTQFNKQLKWGFTLPVLGNQALTRPSVSSGLSNQVNRKNLAEILGLDIQSIFAPRQIHSDVIFEVTPALAGKGAAELDTALEGDACITQNKQILLLTTFADCIPVLLYDPQTNWAATIHSGWKGTFLEIVPKTIALLESKGMNVENLYAAIGPGIRDCCYQIGEDFFQYFTQTRYAPYYTKKGSQWFFNLSEVVYHQILKNGLKQEHIDYPRMCTFCHTQPDFFSYRRDHDHYEAQAAFITLV
ncbi:MAG: peptidoglycan editing factor PgeF [Spirochaetes bacterium]|nr:peptidoglycan editing factor PgeF [Spirochaetota bacterium]